MRAMTGPALLAVAVSAATVFVAACAGSRALAQSGTNSTYCLHDEDEVECIYNTLAQCEASRQGISMAFCQPNNTASLPPPARLPARSARRGS